MKHSIRFRFTLIFVAITTALVAGIFAANKYLLPGYYFNRKVTELEEVYRTMDEIVVSAGGDTAEIQRKLNSSAGNFLKSVGGRSNIDVIIADSENNTLVSTGRQNDWQVMRLRAYLEFKDTITGGHLPDSSFKMVKNNGSYIIQQNYDRVSGAMQLEAWGLFSDQKTAFLLSLPLQSIEENVSITSHFIALVGIAAILIGAVAVAFATNYITKPINSLARISNKMSGLDFSEKYTGKEKDEIGTLGDSINSMSDKLQKTIEDLKEANRKLQEDIDLKEKIDETRKEFISNVSHELKTPIALIEGYAEGLTEGIADDKESRDYYCSVIADEARKMNLMVKQLTSLTNYEFGQNPLVRENFDLSELIKNIVKSEKLRAEDKEAVIRLDLMEPCIVNADEFKIEEVLTNFITNSYNHLGGERNIVIKEELVDNKTVRLSVYNDGEKIPQESLKRIWDKFYKVDKARTRAYGGSGIGLSIVKAIMEAHGNQYGVINREHGVEFFVTLDYAG